MAAPGTLLRKIQDLSNIDNSLFRILAERRSIENELAAQQKVINAKTIELAKIAAALEAKRAVYEKDSKAATRERERNEARKRSLSSLGNYKLQQAAAKEVEAADAELDKHEETLLILLEEIEQLEKQVNGGKEEIDSLQASSGQAQHDSLDALDSLVEKEARTLEDRSQLAALIEPKELAVYDRLNEKLAPDTLADATSGSCSICDMQVAPQMLVQISSGNALIRCRGCGRIFFTRPKE